jgi:Domain of unknown function (DUF4041)/Meiotically up-regulated gene 113
MTPIDIAVPALLATVMIAFALLWFRANRSWAKTRAEFATFKSKFPSVFIDIDSEVSRLRHEKHVLDAALVQASAQAEQDRQNELSRFSELTKALSREHQIKREDWDQKFAIAMQELQRLQGEVESLSEAAEMESFGLYKPRYGFAHAEQYKVQLDRVRESQKAMLKEKIAANCSKVWRVENSEAEGRKMVDRQIKLMLRAFNGDCEAATANVTWKNIVALRDRMRKNFESVNKLGETMSCKISTAFLALRLDELDLAHEYAEKLHAEKEEQRELREQMREEEKAAKEFERERDEAEREEERHKKALEKARAEIAQANAAERAIIDAKVAKLQSLIANAEERKQRAIAQAELTKSGHVYILSNEGSFGSNVFKIGMTRRLDPQDRVDELGSASVPFRFDVHAIIHSDDAPGLEQKLHLALEPHRINLVNHRKEYFRVPLEKIVDLVAQHHGAIQITKAADAAEFRKSLSIRAEREAMVAGKALHASAVTRADEVRARYEELRKATA